MAAFFMGVSSFGGEFLSYSVDESERNVNKEKEIKIFEKLSEWGQLFCFLQVRVKGGLWKCRIESEP